jgi:hypothetical protein
MIEHIAFVIEVIRIAIHENILLYSCNIHCLRPHPFERAVTLWPARVDLASWDKIRLHLSEPFWLKREGDTNKKRPTPDNVNDIFQNFKHRQRHITNLFQTSENQAWINPIFRTMVTYS